MFYVSPLEVMGRSYGPWKIEQENKIKRQNWPRGPTISPQVSTLSVNLLYVADQCAATPSGQVRFASFWMQEVCTGRGEKSLSPRYKTKGKRWHKRQNGGNFGFYSKKGWFPSADCRSKSMWPWSRVFGCNDDFAHHLWSQDLHPMMERNFFGQYWNFKLRIVWGILSSLGLHALKGEFGSG